METTIDLAIEELESTKDYPASDPASDEALDFTIEIMHKYKKITEIVKSWKSDTWTDDVSYDCMMKISEVVEDGND
jgi:hypothetical protein